MRDDLGLCMPSEERALLRLWGYVFGRLEPVILPLEERNLQMPTQRFYQCRTWDQPCSYLCLGPRRESSAHGCCCNSG